MTRRLGGASGASVGGEFNSAGSERRGQGAQTFCSTAFSNLMGQSMPGSRLPQHFGAINLW